MPSPRGIYVRLTQAQRDALRVVAVSRLTSGDRTALSSGGKSGSKNWPVSPDDMLFELDYADKIATNAVRPNAVYADLRNRPLGFQE